MVQPFRELAFNVELCYIMNSEFTLSAKGDLTMKEKIKSKIKTALAKALLATFALATLSPLATAYAATATASALSSRYVVEQATESSDVLIYYNNAQVTFSNPIININGRVYLPVRDLSSLLGTDIKWEQDVRVATVSSQSKTIEVPIGSTQVVVNGTAKQIDAQGTRGLLYHNYTYLPIRCLAEELGHKVDYQTSSNKKYVLIDSQMSQVVEGQPQSAYIANYLKQEYGMTDAQVQETLDRIHVYEGAHPADHYATRDMMEHYYKWQRYAIDHPEVQAHPEGPGNYRGETRGVYVWDGESWNRDMDHFCGFDGLFME